MLNKWILLPRGLITSIEATIITRNNDIGTYRMLVANIRYEDYLANELRILCVGGVREPTHVNVGTGGGGACTEELESLSREGLKI
ncbi:hypothetical protein O3M35_002738 [Rhynocoris fuscipes]|uniref:Uncharacterized protein n=1 Tax=Rhynocoris fuscipes TaxID=488301 RepID=A0AAW1CN49_9HEMI